MSEDEVSKVGEYQINTESKSDLESHSSSDLDSLKSNPFLNPAVAKHYKELYEQSQYECREKFDPEFTWEPEEEKKVVRKLEWRVTFLACFMFAALQIDRINLSQAVSDNLLADLGMTTANYNYGNTIFYVCFLSAELPSQLISKKLGPDVWIPIQMIMWSVVTISQFSLTGKSGFYAARAFLGLFEGGFIPDLVLWMSYFYTSAELSVRLSFFWTALSTAQVISSIIAYGILHMRGTEGHPGWAWLFLIEGLLTLLIGIISAFLMVPSAVQTKKPWNKKGWFTEREEKIVVNRVLRDDPTKGDMHNRQGLTLKMIFNAVMDWHLWPIYLIGIVAYLPLNTLTAYLTLVLKSLGFNTFHVNLLAIPYNVIHVILLIGITKLSEVLKERSFVCLLQPMYSIPLLLVLRFWGGALIQAWPTWVIVTLTLGNPYIHAICVSWCSRNSQSIKTRTVSASIYNMFVQAGAIISSNIYQPDDAPLYHTGNTVLLASSFAMIPIFLFTKWFYVTINKKRDEKWNALTEEEQNDYILNSTDIGSSRLDFRYAH